MDRHRLQSLIIPKIEHLCKILILQNLPPCPVEDVSEDFSKMNRGQDVITESERIKKLEQRLAEAEEERTLLRQEIQEKNATIEVLKEKSTPELLKELQEKFHDEPD